MVLPPVPWKRLVLAALAVAGMMVAGVVAALIVDRKLAYSRHQAFCGAIPRGISKSDFIARLDDRGLTVLPERDEPRVVTGIEMVGFCYLFCDGKFSQDGRLEATKSAGFCD